MVVRFRPKRRCRNCPETEEGLPVQLPQTLDRVITTYEGEGNGLWKAASVACGILLELLFRYVALGVPGKPLPQLERLYARLGEIIEVRKQREKEPSNVRPSESESARPTGRFNRLSDY